MVLKSRKKLFPEAASPVPALQRKVSAQISQCKHWRRLSSRVLTKYILVLDDFTAGVLFRRLPKIQPRGSRLIDAQQQQQEFRTMVRAVCMALHPKLETFKAATLIDIVKGLQRMQLLNEQFMAAWCAAARLRLRAMQPPQLAAAMAALGSLQYCPDDAWVEDFCGVASNRLRYFGHADIAALLRGVASLQLQPSETLMAGLCEVLRNQAVQHSARQAADPLLSKRSEPAAATTADGAAVRARSTQQAPPSSRAGGEEFISQTKHAPLRKFNASSDMQGSLSSAVASLGAVAFLPEGDWVAWYCDWLMPAMQRDDLVPDQLADALEGILGLEWQLQEEWVGEFCRALQRSQGQLSHSSLARCLAALEGGRVMPPPKFCRWVERVSEGFVPDMAAPQMLAVMSALASWRQQPGEAWVSTFALVSFRAIPQLDDSQLLRALQLVSALRLSLPAVWLAQAVHVTHQRLQSAGSLQAADLAPLPDPSDAQPEAASRSTAFAPMSPGQPTPGTPQASLESPPGSSLRPAAFQQSDASAAAFLKQAAAILCRELLPFDDQTSTLVNLVAQQERQALSMLREYAGMPG